MFKLLYLLTGTTAFILLFYNQQPALNVGLFALLVWFFSFRITAKRPKNQFFWILSIANWISAVSFVWYGDGFSFLALLISTLVISFYAQFPKLNLMLYPVMYILNFLTFPFRVFYFKYWLPGATGKENLQKWLATVLIPLLFLTLFIFVYTTGSSLFSGFFKNLFFHADIVQIILLGLLSFFILFNLWIVWIPRIALKLNGELKNDFLEGREKSIIPRFKLFNRSLERKGAEITFILLDILLFIFILTYNYEQFFTADVSGVLSDEIHQRVGTIIGSILLAIGLILFYFRAKVAAEHEKLLSKLAFLWIILNALLVVSAAAKNGEYILNFGLTFKRISVFVFLILCITGLCFTWIKIKFQKTNTFLMTRMGWVIYFTLITLAPVNFSWIVTRYNLTFQKISDSEYLQSLEFNQRILFDNFRTDPDWKQYFEQQQKMIKNRQKNSMLSSILYYRYLKLK